ncbi:MAG: OmpH family outer membrane protein [Halanaerobiaceae bacterium]
MKVIKSRYLAIIVFALLLISVGLYTTTIIGAEEASRDSIAYVDLWSVFNLHPEKSTAENRLNELAQSMQSELEEKAKSLPKDQQQNILKEYQAELSQQEQELIQQIIDKIKDIIVEVAEQKEVRMVIDKKSVIYGGYDMTQDVIDYIQENSEEPESSNQETIAEEINTDQPSNEEINNE